MIKWIIPLGKHNDIKCIANKQQSHKVHEEKTESVEKRKQTNLQLSLGTFNILSAIDRNTRQNKSERI